MTQTDQVTPFVPLRPRDTSRKIAIYAGDPVNNLLSQATSASSAINTAVARYLEVCERYRPALSVGEWDLLADLLASSIYHLDPKYLAVEVRDLLRSSPRAKQWASEGQVLAKRLEGLGYAECVSIVQALDRFWAKSGAAKDDDASGSLHAWLSIVGPAGVRNDVFEEMAGGFLTHSLELARLEHAGRGGFLLKLGDRPISYAVCDEEQALLAWGRTAEELQDLAATGYAEA
jgi:hypothetical protein